MVDKLALSTLLLIHPELIGRASSLSISPRRVSSKIVLRVANNVTCSFWCFFNGRGIDLVCVKCFLTLIKNLMYVYVSVDPCITPSPKFHMVRLFTSSVGHLNYFQSTYIFSHIHLRGPKEVFNKRV